jgi:hypothetical protein
MDEVLAPKISPEARAVILEKLILMCDVRFNYNFVLFKKKRKVRTLWMQISFFRNSKFQIPNSKFQIPNLFVLIFSFLVMF